MERFETPPRYRIYLLRFWGAQRAHASTDSVPRFCLEDPDTGKRYDFSTLEALIGFVQGSLSIDVDELAYKQPE